MEARKQNCARCLQHAKALLYRFSGVRCSGPVESEDLAQSLPERAGSQRISGCSEGSKLDIGATPLSGPRLTPRCSIWDIVTLSLMILIVNYGSGNATRRIVR